jgi:hypothetical protein
MGAGMTIILYSDNDTVIKKFDSLGRARNFDFSVKPVSELKDAVKKQNSDTIYYLDISAPGWRDQTKLVRFLAKQDSSRIGIIDKNGIINDPAALFHAGAIDYIGQTILKKGIPSKRIKQILKYADTHKIVGTEVAEKDTPTIYSGKDWKTIKPGKEYTFCFMFTELDLHADWEKKSGKYHLDKVGTDFHNFIERRVSPMNGNIWIWDQFGGLVLFPFDGHTCDPILECFKIILNRTIISTEEFPHDILLSYRIVLDIGNTVYRKRGDTGTVISDTVNSLYHLGKRFAKPGNFYLTETVLPHVPPGIADYFLYAGEFERKKLYRMLLPKS